jgi:heme-degrading monooxygenase HmoA
MFVVIINFPPIKTGKDAEFLKWFAGTNKTFANYKGFIGRRLLKPIKGGNYAAIVEHESQETFLAMHNSPAHDEASKGLGPLSDGNTSPQFFRGDHRVRCTE